MADIAFYLLALLTVLSSVGVVVYRNAVKAALCLLVGFVGVGALFALLGAYFLAAVQVLVYAGAVAVIFAFVVMLFDVKGGTPRLHRSGIAVAAGTGAAALLLAGVISLAKHGPCADGAATTAVGANLKAYGIQLFTTYLLPVEVTGFLLLVAMLGVTVLSRKQAETPGSGSPREGGNA